MDTQPGTNQDQLLRAQNPEGEERASSQMNSGVDTASQVRGAVCDDREARG